MAIRLKKDKGIPCLSKICLYNVDGMGWKSSHSFIYRTRYASLAEKAVGAMISMLSLFGII